MLKALLKFMQKWNKEVRISSSILGNSSADICILGTWRHI